MIIFGQLGYQVNKNWSRVKMYPTRITLIWKNFNFTTEVL